MPEKSGSPAVQSVLNERQEQRKRSTGSDLDNALKDTFPASDPISATHTAVPSGRVAAETSEGAVARGHVDRFEDSYPMRRTTSKPASEPDTRIDAGTARRNVRALYKAVRRIGTYDHESMSRPAVAAPGCSSVVGDIKQKIRQRPLLSVIAAAAIGFVLSSTR